MPRPSYLALAALTIYVGSILAQGQPPASRFPLPTWFQGCARVPACGPDDYVVKPLPAVFLHKCFGANDYCRKTVPDVILGPSGCIDDYVPKSYPVCPLQGEAGGCRPAK